MVLGRKGAAAGGYSPTFFVSSHPNTHNPLYCSIRDGHVLFLPGGDCDFYFFRVFPIFRVFRENHRVSAAQSLSFHATAERGSLRFFQAPLLDFAFSSAGSFCWELYVSLCTNLFSAF